MFYSKLTADQVASTYTLIRFLERLKIIGHLNAHTAPAEEDSGDIFGDYYYGAGIQYSIVKDSYDPDKSYIDAYVELEKLFGRNTVKSLRGTN